MGGIPMGDGKWERRGNRTFSHSSQIIIRTGCMCSGRSFNLVIVAYEICRAHRRQKRRVSLHLRRHNVRPPSFAATAFSSGKFTSLPIISHNHFAPHEPIKLNIEPTHKALLLYWKLSNVVVHHGQDMIYNIIYFTIYICMPHLGTRKSAL